MHGMQPHTGRPTRAGVGQSSQQHQHNAQQQHLQHHHHHQQQQPQAYYNAPHPAMQHQQHLAALYSSQRSSPAAAAAAGVTAGGVQGTSPGSSTPTAAVEERPRVRTDGPGGPDVKQGARIACLDCRTAKIRCSAPTDGVVPCKRCARHDKECIFEKHRRGRKPGKWTGNGVQEQVEDAAELATPKEQPQPVQQHQQAGPSFVPMLPQRNMGETVPNGMPYWSPRGTMAAPPTGRVVRPPTFAPASATPGVVRNNSNGVGAPFMLINGLPSPSLPPTNASILAGAGSRAWPGTISLPPQPRISNTLEHHTPGTASIPRSWLDFASPGRSLLSPSLSLNVGLTAILPNGSPPSSTLKRKTTADEASASASASTTAIGKNNEEHSQQQPDAKRARTAAKSHSVSDGSSDAEEEVDQLDEDLVGGGQNDDVLSTPLRLLAHASDAAAASKAGEEKGSTGAATMGLVSPPLRGARRIPGMLSHLRGTALGEGALPSRIPPLLPGVATLRAASSSVRTQLIPPFAVGLPPPRQALGALGVVGRSRSYTAGEGQTAQSKLTQDAITFATAAAAVAGVGVGRTEVGLVNPPLPLAQLPSDATPSTRDHAAWEYRAGKARARGTGGSASAQGSAEPPGNGPLAKVELLSDEAHSQASPHDVGSTGSGPGTTTRRGKTSLRNMRRRSRATGDGEGPDSNDPTDELEAGASHPDYFSLSLFSSFLDNNEKFDPIDLGMIEIREVEKLFDVFFARINPLLNLFDPFLHSVAYVRSRSVLLMTVIVALAARLSDSPRDAELAVLMERHWREKLLPEVLLGGLKSVEIAQSFLLLANYHAPAKRLADDRSWQYLGFACRIATEIGVNRPVAPSGSLRDSEQLRRRIRNRWRTWFVCFLSDRTLSAQTGRPFTIIEDEMVMASALWHREDFALPEDVSLVCLIKLRRLIAQHSEAFNVYLSAAKSDGTATDFAGLELFRKGANSDLERWRDAWCIRSADEASVQSLAMAAFLVRWRPTALLHYEHARLYLNLIVLQALEPQRDAQLDAPVALDCWHSATRLIDVLLDDTGPEELEASPNQTAIMATWAALAALRLTKLDHAWVDGKAMVQRAKRLAQALGRAGRSPAHRNGAAGPYGSYLRSVLEIWLPSPKPASEAGGSSTTGDIESAVAVATPSPVKEKLTGVPAPAAATVVAVTAPRPPMDVTVPTVSDLPVPLVLSDLSVPIVQPSNGVSDTGLQTMMPATPSMMHSGIGAPITPGTAAAVAASSSFLSLPHDFMSASADVSALAPPDPENIDMAFDYLTAFEGVGFPAGLWQPQATWGGNNP